MESTQLSISGSLSCFAHDTDVIYLLLIYENMNVSKIPIHSLSYHKKINLGLDNSVFSCVKEVGLNLVLSVMKQKLYVCWIK